MVLWLPPLSVAENLNRPRMEAGVMAANSETVLAEEVTALPGRAPVLIAPMVRAPQVAVPHPIPRELQKLALKYDVTKIGERTVGTGMNFFSVEREVEMGQEISEQMESEVRFVNDPVITEYVNRLDRTWCAIRMQRRSEEHTSELQSLRHLVCRLLL